MKLSINYFKLINKLGEGATGEVFEDSPKDRTKNQFQENRYAIKRYKPALFTYSDARDRLQREQRLLKKIRHPNIVRYYHFEIQNNPAFSVSEFFDARDLTEVKKLADASSVLRQILKALSYLHQKGVLHRDVKPENVLFDGSVAKLCDFGVARGKIDDTLTASNQFLGTIRYAPPEYLFDGHYTEASDLYGLGQIAYYLVEGESLISPDQIFSQQVLSVQNSTFEGFQKGSQFSNRAVLEKMTSRLLEKDPERRLDDTSLISDVLNLPDLKSRDQNVIISYLSMQRLGIPLPDLKSVIKCITEARLSVQGAAKEWNHFIEDNRIKITEKIDSHKNHARETAIVACYLGAGDGEAIESLLSQVFNFDEYTRLSDPDPYILSDSQKLTLLAISHIEKGSEKRSELAKLVENDSLALSHMRQAFIENADPGDSDAYNETWKFNEWLTEKILDGFKGDNS